MSIEHPFRRTIVALAALTLVVVSIATLSRNTPADEPSPQASPPDQEVPSSVQPQSIQIDFDSTVGPFLEQHCTVCHNADDMTSGVRVDHLSGPIEERHIKLWEVIRSQLSDEAMPPEDEEQPSNAERRKVLDWIDGALDEARSRDTELNGTVRRLTVAQYRNTLRDLLGLREDLTDVLPADGVSKDGFLNNAETLSLSPLLVEAYFGIAERALELSIVDETVPPEIQSFRMDLGERINRDPCPDNLILGANSLLLANEDFVVEETEPDKPFEFTPFEMRRQYTFNEGYQGNSTVRGIRNYDSIYHAVFACMRGNPGYPLGEPYETVPGGLLLRPAIPGSELFGRSSTYGPMANFKVSLRELPDHGDFRVRVTAARYDDCLLLEKNARVSDRPKAADLDFSKAGGRPSVVGIDHGGLYEVAVEIVHGESSKSVDDAQGEWGRREPKPSTVTLKIGSCQASRAIQKRAGRKSQKEEGGEQKNKDVVETIALMVVRLPEGQHSVATRTGKGLQINRVEFRGIDESSELGQRFLKFEKRSPRLGVYLGLRRDCGSTLGRVGQPVVVDSYQPQTFVFEDAINNYSSPDVQENNDNYLAGIREIGVRCEYTDGREMPRLNILSVEFEGPYYKSWPPESHRRIFIDSPNREQSDVYAREVIESFAGRAFRRPVTNDELASLMRVWKRTFEDSGDFRNSIKDALTVVLTSPQFLFLIENSRSPEPEDIEPYELASKLSYFLWNTAPDDELLTLAASGELRTQLDKQTRRMMKDARFSQFTREFATQWLSLDKFDVVEVDGQKYPKLTRSARMALREEPIEFLRYCINQNLPVRELVESEVILANEAVASYYGFPDRTESGFAFVPIRHEDRQLGGLLSQASILSGLSDGRESNPVKRGAWLARKIVAEPPDDPPPNVPQIMDDDPSLTLRQKLERHRNQKGCVKCHTGIDPWGVPFETFDAGGRFQQGVTVDASSTLPDETEVADLVELKAYLVRDRIDQIAFSVLKHLAVYACGRSLSYNELAKLRADTETLRASEYRMQNLIQFVVQSDLFLKK